MSPRHPLVFTLSGLLLGLCLNSLHADAEAAQNAARELLDSFSQQGYINISSQRRGLMENGGRTAFTTTLLDGQSYLALVSGDKGLTGLEILIADPADSYNILNRSAGGGTKASLKWTQKNTRKVVFFIRNNAGSGHYHFYLVTGK